MFHTLTLLCHSAWWDLWIPKNTWRLTFSCFAPCIVVSCQSCVCSTTQELFLLWTLLPSFPLLSQSQWPKWSACVKAASPRRWGGCLGRCRRTGASQWSSEEPGRAWTCCAPARTKPGTGCEGSALWRSTWPTWVRRKNWTNILPNFQYARINIVWLRLHC